MEARENVRRLTNTIVEAAACPPGRPNFILWDEAVKGLGVRINAAGTTRTYLFQFRVKGTRQERQIKIGRHKDPWRIDQARAKANQLKVEMEGGVDPVLRVQQKVEADKAALVRTRADTITLDEVMTHYLENHRTTHRAPLRKATQRDIRRHITVNLADWMSNPVAAIKRDDCIERFNAIAESSETQAEQCFAYLRSLLNYAKDMFETEDGEFPLLPVNPVQRMFKKVKPAKPAERDVRIPMDRIRQVWVMLQERRATGRLEVDRTAADWISFIMLTGTRRGESGSLLWENVDLGARTFHLPKEVVKNHNGITLPMSTTLHDMLTRRRKAAADEAEASRLAPSPYVFPATTGETGHMQQAQATMRAVAEVAGMHIQIHDLRRTFVDVCAAVGVSASAERMLVNHKSGDLHDRHYANGKQSLSGDVERIAEWITAQP